MEQIYEPPETQTIEGQNINHAYKEVKNKKNKSESQIDYYLLFVIQGNFCFSFISY